MTMRRMGSGDLTTRTLEMRRVRHPAEKTKLHLGTHAGAALGPGWALGKTDTIGLAFTDECAALAIFDG
jgi:hypothetical protein